MNLGPPLCAPVTLHEVQRLPTSGARAVEPFAIDGVQFLAVPQLAMDVPDQPAAMTSGDSDCPTLIYRWHERRFVEHQRLDVPGGEDAEFFEIGDRRFLAVASLRSGRGPYSMEVDSILFEWKGERFEPLQRFPTFAAKQWRHLEIDGRHFLALAQGVTLAERPAGRSGLSGLFEWTGERFEHFHDVASAWGYNWHAFEAGGERWLAYADHAEPSCLLRWDGRAFEPVQRLDGTSGRAFSTFHTAGDDWLAFANLLGDTLLYRRDGERYVQHQKLSGPGGRELHWLALPEQGADAGALLQVNFIQGSREAPRPMQQSLMYAHDGDSFVDAGVFASSGGTDCATFDVAGVRHLAVANSLSADVRFGTDSVIYRIEPA